MCFLKRHFYYHFSSFCICQDECRMCVMCEHNLSGGLQVNKTIHPLPPAAVPFVVGREDCVDDAGNGRSSFIIQERIFY